MPDQLDAIPATFAACSCTVHVIDTEPRALINMSWLEDDTKVWPVLQSPPCPPVTAPPYSHNFPCCCDLVWSLLPSYYSYYSFLIHQTEKYVMSDAEYSKRENSFRKFKQQQLQQQQGGGPADDAQAPDASPGLCSSVACAAERVAELAEAVCSAGRCIAEPGARKGVVR